jgi:acetylglutamate/LysW-gamma-L-alpha-aminoadipate kinase
VERVTVVVKVGGGEAVDPGGAVEDVAHLTATGEERAERSSAAHPSGRSPRGDVVVVHGGSTAVDDLLERLGMEPEYVETPNGVAGRFTDADAMEAFTMAMARVNQDLVADLQAAGVNAVGLSGVDGKLLTGPRKSAVRVLEDGRRKIRRGDHSGTVEAVNADLLETLLDAGYTPVVGPPMYAADDTAVNADADRVAAAVAGALGAELVVLTDVPGLLADPDDETTLLESVATPDDLEAAEAAAEGFMTKKVMAATEALEGGAPGVVVADANANDPVLEALEGAGTRFEPGALGRGHVENHTEVDPP